MTEQLYTVKDLASMTAVAKDAETVNRVMRQIRHWTNSDVLSPFGPKRTGTGVSRVYDAHGARKAAILVELSRYSVTVEMLHGFDAWCDETVDSEEWQCAVEGLGPMFIAVTWNPGEPGEGRWQVLANDELWAMMTGDTTAVENPETDFEFLDASSLVVINLTQVFARVQG